MTSNILNWTGYLYGALTFSKHIQYTKSSEDSGESSVLRGIKRMGYEPKDIAKKRVLEVGSGIYALGFNRLGAQVEHHNISTKTVQALGQYAKENNYTNIKTFHTNLESDKLPESHFDIIYWSGVYQHMKNPAQGLVNVCKALKPGGKLYVDIYRSGRFRWFVVDTLRKITHRSMLHEVLDLYGQIAALGNPYALELRQVELMSEDPFVEHIHLFHPQSLISDCQTLGMELDFEPTSMDIPDPRQDINHSLFFAHVFNTMVFTKTNATKVPDKPLLTNQGQCQIQALAQSGMPQSQMVAELTSDFVLAHQAGKFSRMQHVSHIANLFRMAHPAFKHDPYFVPGNQEPRGASSTHQDENTCAQRYSLWCTFLSQCLKGPNPHKDYALESLGYELIKHVKT